MTDYAFEMRRFVDEHTASGPYVPRVAASEIVDKLRANRPDLLAGWLDQQAEHFVWQMINDRDRSRRSHAMHSRRPSAFRRAAEDAQGGDETSLRKFLDAPYTVSDGSRRPLATLTHADLVFVAKSYEQLAAENGFRAAVMRALAKRVKTGTVEDYYTEEQLAAMWSSVEAA